ncbi:glycoside hydrolase family 2 protein [Gluconacetobacter tumulisoli]|uniref:Uncharacterized protein n=1 Tax=Gluconacetobacter tumulisoli TaxID=1286189 RepID=A0A7W4K9V8_9PROT|nr:hypothetical protein [Gluconacetobacter tumulisoli]MBB2203026.1 hypothetical protein [Gluconacetobacter tumulisoli]
MTGHTLDAPPWFTAPEARFRTAAFWFWDHIPDEATCRAALAGMKDAGLGSVMVQARLSLPLDDYLSPAYLARCRFVGAEATRLGLGIEIYDEYCWMSGHGGGRVVQGADHLRERHLFWTRGQVTRGEAILDIGAIRSPFLDFLGPAVRTWCYEDGTPRWADWQPVATFVEGASPPAGYRLETNAAVEVIATRDDGCTIRILLPDCADGTRVTLFLAGRCATSRLVNYLLPEAAARFARKVYAPLRDALGGGGFFFDHPYAGFYIWDGHYGALGNSLPWADDLLTTAEMPELLALVQDVGPRTDILRAGFFTRHARRIRTAFLGTLRYWCDAHQVEFSGHELLTHVGGWDLRAGIGGIDPRVMPGVDYFAFDSYRSATSVDAADYRMQLSARLGDSVARANGRSRCTVEQYATGRETGAPSLAGQWGLTAERLRMQCIRHLLSGARRVVLHALYLTDGFDPGTQDGFNPRFDFPPGFNFQPWWQDMPGTFTELARLSAFLEDGTPLRAVALLYPLDTLWTGGGDLPCTRSFGWWAQALTDAGVGFDIVDERQLALATLDGGELVLPGGRYACIILPHVTLFQDGRTAACLAAFLDSGGRVLHSGAPPVHCRRAEPSDALARLRAGMPPPCDTPDAIARAIARHLSPAPLRIEGAPQRVAAQMLGKTLRLACVNDGDIARTAVLAPAPVRRAVDSWDAASGTIHPLAVVPENATLHLDLPAQGLLCLDIRDIPSDTPDRAIALVPRPMGTHLSADDADSLILIDEWMFRPADGDDWASISTTCGWEQQGYPRFAGTGIYRRTIALPPPPEGATWHLVLPHVAGSVTCLLDGAPVGTRVTTRAVFALTWRPGMAEIELHVRNTAANRYYAGTPLWDGTPHPSGLRAPPRIEAWRPLRAPDISGQAGSFISK